MIERSWLVEAGRWSNVCQICTHASEHARIGSALNQVYFTGEDFRGLA
jgi:hypothetical protein